MEVVELATYWLGVDILAVNPRLDQLFLVWYEHAWGAGMRWTKFDWIGLDGRGLAWLVFEWVGVEWFVLEMSWSEGVD